MGRRILKQPDGKFAVWSTTVEDFLVEDASKRQLIQWYVGEKATEAYEHIEGRISELEEHGEIQDYYTGVSTYEDALERKQETSGNGD